VTRSVLEALAADVHPTTRVVDLDRPDLRTTSGCPACGSDDTRTDLFDRYPSGKRTPVWQGVCRECGHEGPTAATLREALRAWGGTDRE
jgi:hypothetical protein